MRAPNHSMMRSTSASNSLRQSGSGTMWYLMSPILRKVLRTCSGHAYLRFCPKISFDAAASSSSVSCRCVGNHCLYLLESNTQILSQGFPVGRVFAAPEHYSPQDPGAGTKAVKRETSKLSMLSRRESGSGFVSFDFTSHRETFVQARQPFSRIMRAHETRLYVPAICLPCKGHQSHPQV